MKRNLPFPPLCTVVFRRFFFFFTILMMNWLSHYIKSAINFPDYGWYRKRLEGFSRNLSAILNRVRENILARSRFKENSFDRLKQTPRWKCWLQWIENCSNDVHETCLLSTRENDLTRTRIQKSSFWQKNK